MIKYILLFLFLSGCASQTPQVDALLNDRDVQLPRSHWIPSPTFIAQQSAECGPTTLTMQLNWIGDDVTVSQLGPQVMSSTQNETQTGSLRADMIGAARRRGMLAIEIHGLKSLLTELSADHPVIIFENLSVSWWPQWHYALVFGYDLDAEDIRLHTGPQANKLWNIRKFERSWALGDYWGLVVLPPTQTAASADELTHLKAAVALEDLGRTQAALQLYQAILVRWPRSLPALIGAANTAYADGQRDLAIRYLRAAIKNFPQSEAAQNNLSYVLSNP